MSYTDWFQIQLSGFGPGICGTGIRWGFGDLYPRNPEATVLEHELSSRLLISRFHM